MFSSATSAKLQEIGPRFTLKLRWLRKGLPSVAAPDGHVSVGGDPADDIYAGDINGADVGLSSEEIAQEEKDEEDEALKEIGQPAQKKNAYEGTEVPALDEEQEYEWKWKVSGSSLGKASHVDAYDTLCSRRWKYRGEPSFCNAKLIIISPLLSLANLLFKIQRVVQHHLTIIIFIFIDSLQVASHYLL